MNRLKTSLGKLKMKNPVTVASGTFGVEYNDFYDLSKLGAIVTKTITSNPKIGNPSPRLCETSGGLLNSIGLQNPGVEKFISEDLPMFKKFNTPLIVSFSGTTIQDFVNILIKLENQQGIDGYEINVSCPNVEKEGMAFGTDPEVVFNLTKSLSEITDRDLIIKLTPNVTDIAEIALAVEEAGADSLALINTLLGMAIDWKTGKSLIRKGIAGYSGPSIKPVALMNVYKVAKKVKIPILAMGGISTWKDALEFFYAGASAIAIGTSNFVNPNAGEEIIDALDLYFAEENKLLKDVIGSINGIE